MANKMGIGGKAQTWPDVSAMEVNADELAQLILKKGRPVHLNQLVPVAVEAWLETLSRERRYMPGDSYSAGEIIRFNGQPAKVEAVQIDGNPKQGRFQILKLAFPDGTKRYVAAGVRGAPIEEHQPVVVDKKQVQRIIEQHDLAVRAAIKRALDADDRFVWFQDAQGDHWCLVEMLPEVKGEEIARVLRLLRGLLADGEIHPKPTEDLVMALWGQENDGSKDYMLKAFSLNVALWQRQDVRWLGDGWVLEAEWQELQERPTLVAPRQPNVITIPQGVRPVEEEDDGADVDVEEGEQPTATDTVEKDLEAWRRNRILNVTIALKAQHYYGNWLPLTRAMRRLLPPRASGAYVVTFYHRFGAKEESFQAYVNWGQRRILGSPKMYEAFYEHGIYPGARLVISHRGSEREYEIRTKPVESEQRVLVRRVFLGDDGTLEYEEVEEPIRYEIEEDVFVADARWDDLDALFRQAEEVGAGIFQLMYEKCCEWWKEKGRQPLYVTASELFPAIHFDERDRGRLTSKATIAWEMWRHRAFEPVGGGRYRFRPEYGDQVRVTGPGTSPKAQGLSLPATDTSPGTLPGKHESPPDESRIEPTPLDEYELPLLSVLVELGGEGRPAKDIFPRLEKRMKLNDADRNRRKPGGEIRWKENAYFAFEKLVKKGEAEKPEYGIWRVTDEGRTRLAEAGLLTLPPPTFERTRTGQLIDTRLVPPDPLFKTLTSQSEEIAEELSPENSDIERPTEHLSTPPAPPSPPSSESLPSRGATERPKMPLRPPAEPPRTTSKPVFSKYNLKYYRIIGDRLKELIFEDVIPVFIRWLRSLWLRQR